MKSLRTVLGAALVASLLASCTGHAASPGDAIRVGAIYPLSGSQGPGGLEEFRGVQIAADMVNAAGGVDGRPIELVPVDAPGVDDGRPGRRTSCTGRACASSSGSYGSTISEPAATAAARDGMLFWETGAVGDDGGARPRAAGVPRRAQRRDAGQGRDLVHRRPSSPGGCTATRGRCASR